MDGTLRDNGPSVKQGNLRQDDVDWSNYKGSAADLWHCWWAERNLKLTRTVIIKGDTPFTQELRESDHFAFCRRYVQDNLKLYAHLSEMGVEEREQLLKGEWKRYFTNWKDPLTRGPSDLFDMFVELPLGIKFNVADVFLGSYDVTFTISDINLTNRTANVTFHITNTTGWHSASKYPFGHHWASDGDGAVYKQEITWTESISW